MDYLITGGNGFIGKNLCVRLREIGASFTIVDTNYSDDLSIPHYDITERGLVQEAETIIHLAADTSVRDSIKDPRRTYQRNIKGMLNCLETFRHSDKVKKLIFTSSASSELCSSPYLASKHSCESLCRAYADSYNLDITTLKLSNVYGPHSTHKQSVIHKFIKNCIDRRPLKIYGDGTQERDFIPVDAVIHYILNAKYGEYLITSGYTVPINMIAKYIREASGEFLDWMPDVINMDAVQGEVMFPMNTNGVPHKIPLFNGIRETFKWYMENYNGDK